MNSRRETNHTNKHSPQIPSTLPQTIMLIGQSVLFLIIVVHTIKFYLLRLIQILPLCLQLDTQFQVFRSNFFKLLSPHMHYMYRPSIFPNVIVPITFCEEHTLHKGSKLSLLFISLLFPTEYLKQNPQ